MAQTFVADPSHRTILAPMLLSCPMIDTLFQQWLEEALIPEMEPAAGHQAFFCDTHSPWQKRRRRKRHRAPQTLPPPQTNLNISPTPHALTTIPIENVSTS
jgi:hypothetical protein